MHRQSGEQTEVIVWMSDKEKTASAESIEEACLLGILSELADEYLLSCLPKQNEKKEGECIDSEQKGKSTKKRDGGDKREPKFPNVAGFCRYFGIGRGKYERLSKKYPEEFEKLFAVFEDEALNSQISPSLLSTYLKKRLGYSDASESTQTEVDTDKINLIFDHDIFVDGE